MSIREKYSGEPKVKETLARVGARNMTPATEIVPAMNDPKAAYERLVSAMKATLNDARMKDLLTKAGYIVEYKDPQEFSKIINKDWGVFSEVLKEAGMKPN